MRFDIGNSGDEPGQFIACVEGLFQLRYPRHSAVIRMRENRAADFLAHAPLGQEGVALHRMVGSVRMDLPIEIVEKRGYRPLRFVLAQSPRIGADTRLYRERVPAQTFRLSEFAENGPGLRPVGYLGIRHGFHHSEGNESPQAAWRPARKRSRSRRATRTVARPLGVQVSSTMRPGWCRGRRTIRAGAKTAGSRPTAT